MQQNLKFPAQCTVIPAEELEQILRRRSCLGGGAEGSDPPLLAEGKALSGFWHRVRQGLCAGHCGGIQHLHLWPDHSELHVRHQGQPELVQGPELKISGYETSPCAVCSLNGAGGRLFVSLSGRFLICKRFYFVERKLCTLSNRFQIQLPQSQHLLCCPYSLLILGISCGFSRNLFKCSAHL